MDKRDKIKISSMVLSVSLLLSLPSFGLAEEKAEIKAMDNLEESLGNLKGSAKALKEENKQLKVQNAQLESEIGDLKKQSNTLAQAYERRAKELSERGAQVSTAESTSKAPVDKNLLKHLKTEKQDLLKRIAAIKKEDEKVAANFELLNGFIADLEKKIQIVQEPDPVAIQEQKEMFKKLTDEIQSVQNEIKKEKLAQQKISKQEPREYPATLKNFQLTSAIEREKSTLSNLLAQEEIFRQEKLELEAKRKENLDGLNTKIAEFKDRHQELNSFLSLIDKKFKPEDLGFNDLPSEVDELSQNLLFLQDENGSLKNKLIKLMETKINLERRRSLTLKDEGSPLH